MKRLYPLDPPRAVQIVARRRALHWSQNSLALRAGLTEALMAKLETVRVPITPEHQRAIENALAAGERDQAPGRAVAVGGVR